MSTEVADESLLLDTLWSHWSESYMSVACQGPEHTSRPTPDFWGSQADNCGLCSTEPISRWKVSLYWWTSKSFCDKPLLNKHILNVPRHLWEFDSLGDILISPDPLKKAERRWTTSSCFTAQNVLSRPTRSGLGNYISGIITGIMLCMHARMHLCTYVWVYILGI